MLPPSGGSRSLRCRTAHESYHASFEVRQRERLGEDVSQLVTCRYSDKAHATVLNHFVSEVLADVDVLGALSSANNMVPLMIRLPHLMHAVLSS